MITQARAQQARDDVHRSITKAFITYGISMFINFALSCLSAIIVTNCTDRTQVIMWTLSFTANALALTYNIWKFGEFRLQSAKRKHDLEVSMEQEGIVP